MFWADLHTHTTASDGLDFPAELVQRASSQGISVLAVTDHDTTAGVAEASVAATENQITLVHGVEFSVRARRGQTHILGYGIDIDNRALQQQLEVLRQGRAERGRQIVQRLEELGIQLPLEDDSNREPGQSAGRPHIARRLVEVGAATSVEDAFARYLSVGRPAFVPRPTLSAHGAIEIIRDAGGLAVLAHPLSVFDLDQQLERFVDAGLDGLEAFYGEYSINDREALAGLARSKELLVTGGSDYHGGSPASGRRLGSVNWPCSDVEALLERLG